jgi:hypothetical protein
MTVEQFRVRLLESLPTAAVAVLEESLPDERQIRDGDGLVVAVGFAKGCGEGTDCAPCLFERRRKFRRPRIKIRARTCAACPKSRSLSEHDSSAARNSSSFITAP